MNTTIAHRPGHRIAVWAALLLVSPAAPFAFAGAWEAESGARPNVVLVMADDQGWGETGYNGHPRLKTPVLDEMAAAGLRFDRFYAAAPVCSPTRASVLTGRHPNRSGVFAPNYCTRPEEITIAQILKTAGYRTGHFGKWHVGAVKSASPLNPSRMGFDEYLSHDNFFEMNPPLSRNGNPPEIRRGESSKVIVEAASDFVRRVRDEGNPFFVVIWFGSPHSPYFGLPEDEAQYGDVPGESLRHRFAEIAAMDRAVGQFRRTLAELGLARDTLLWYTSDNGITTEGIPAPQRAGLYNGPWREAKGSIYEGGLRVPAIIEWPAVVRKPRRTSVPCVTSDILPTLLDFLRLESPDPRRPVDGISLRGLIETNAVTMRPKAIGFWKYDAGRERGNPRWLDPELTQGTTPTARNPAIDFMNFRHPVARTGDFGGQAAWTDNRYKLVSLTRADAGTDVELYDLLDDPGERTNLAKRHPEIVKRMTAALRAWQRSVERSLSGADY